jgi:enoyl-CoA hydratase/carnithine racemase
MSAPAPTAGVRLAMAADGVGVLSWCRQGRRNALDLSLVEAISERLASLERTPLRALVLWGEGGDFSAGADLEDVRAIAAGGRVEALEYSLKVQALTDAVEALALPVVAAIEGVCLGLGLEIALAAAVRVAASDARLGLPEMRHGLYPAAGGTARLPEAVGEGRARALILEGRVLDADEAHALGLVARLTAPGQARQAAIACALEAAPFGPAAARFLAVRRAARGEAFGRALAAEREGFADLVRTTAVRGRLEAFLARRRKPGATADGGGEAAPAAPGRTARGGQGEG